MGKEHVIIEWLKPESDGGSEIKTYFVDKREKNSTRFEQFSHLQLTRFILPVYVLCVHDTCSRSQIRWTRVNKTYTIYDTRLKITGLLEGSEYQFRVTAVNAAGDSQPSDASPYILLRDPTCENLRLFVELL